MSCTLHVAIVGAGPAGSAAATVLARKGARVTLLERKRFPRDKICGDGLSPRCLQTMRTLEIPEPAALESQRVTRFFLSAPNGRTVSGDLPAEPFGGRGAIVPRMIFDEHLVRVATAAGAELREGCTVSEIERGPRGVRVRFRDGEPLDADLILGCDGSPSIVRRNLGARAFPPNHSIFAVRAYYENVRFGHPNAFAVYFDERLVPGYFWIFPLPGGRANVGVGMPSDKLAAAPFKLKALLAQMCATPAVARDLAGARRVGPIVGHHIPLGSFARELVFDRALLLGDAAGFVNPVSGEGIEFALDSGLQAAKAIETAERIGDFSAFGLSSYKQLCEDSFRRPFDMFHRLSFMLRSVHALNLIARVASRSAAVRQELLVNPFGGVAPRPSLSLLRDLVFGA